MKDKRIIYYVFTATADENQNGTYHKHGGYLVKWRAEKLAKQLRLNLLNDFVVLERHFQKYIYPNWEPDFDLEHTTEVVEHF